MKRSSTTSAASATALSGRVCVWLMAMVVLPPADFVRWVVAVWGRRASADGSAKDAQVIAAGDLSRLLGGKAAAQHRRDEVHPLAVVRHAARGDMLVGANADVIDPDDLGHFLQAVDVFVEAREEVPDADRAAGFGDRPRVIGGDLPPAQRRWPHRPRPGESRVRQ